MFDSTMFTAANLVNLVAILVRGNGETPRGPKALEE